MAAKKPEAKKQTPSEEAALEWGNYAGQGHENVTQDDLGFPFLAIMQKGSPEVDEDNDKYVEGLKVGDIIMTTTKKKYGDKTNPVSVVPVGYQKAYVEWTPREKGGGYVGTHGRTIMTQTTKNDKGQDELENGNIIVTTGYFMVLVYDEDENDWVQAVIAMSSTQLKKSRQWLNVMASHKMDNGKGGKFLLPMFSHKYNLTSVPESNDKGNWLGWHIEVDEILKEAALVGQASAKHKEIAEGSMQMLAPPTGEGTDVPF